MKVAVLDAGSGNIRSVLYALRRLGIAAFPSAEVEEIANADGLVVPGVGACQSVMEKLRAINADKVITARIAAGRSVLGICVGMQILFTSSTEHGGCAGLGIWRGEVKRLEADIIPHMGWSPVKAGNGTKLLAGLENERFYFVHSYAVKAEGIGDLTEEGVASYPIVSYAEYGKSFLAAVEDGALAAVQFHPEKSAEAGMGLWENWISGL